MPLKPKIEAISGAEQLMRPDSGKRTEYQRAWMNVGELSVSFGLTCE